MRLKNLSYNGKEVIYMLLGWIILIVIATLISVVVEDRIKARKSRKEVEARFGKALIDAETRYHH